MEYSLQIIGLEKSFGGKNRILKGVSLDIEEGEFITLLGPSGCGKTTTLRIISGLETPDKGKVYLDGIDITSYPPNKRNMNTVFQNYALFPHMNVEDNIGYGLKIKKVNKKEIKERVKKSLELVQLEGFEKRRPDELSGGQKQRVAIARALINNPKVLLLDEPLGALDLQLRRDMQIELKRLQKKLNITFIYITHDQDEAISMSDRIVVMNEGEFKQIGTPDEIYNHPKTSYVAKFVGNANIIKGKVASIREDLVEVEMAGGSGVVQNPGFDIKIGQSVTIAIRSENVLLDKNCNCGLKAVVSEKTFHGGGARIMLTLPTGETIISSSYGLNNSVDVGDEVCWRFACNQGVFVDLKEDEDEK